MSACASRSIRDMLCAAASPRAPTRPVLLHRLVSCIAATGARTVTLESRSAHRRLNRRDSSSSGNNAGRPVRKLRVSDNGGSAHARRDDDAMKADVELGPFHPQEAASRGSRVVAELLPLCVPHGLGCWLSNTEQDAPGAPALSFEHR